MATHKYQDATLEDLAAKFGFDFLRLDDDQADAFFVQENEDELPDITDTVAEAARMLKLYGDGAAVLCYTAHGDGGDALEIDNISDKTFEQLCDEIVTYLTYGYEEV